MARDFLIQVVVSVLFCSLVVMSSNKSFGSEYIAPQQVVFFRAIIDDFEKRAYEELNLLSGASGGRVHERVELLKFFLSTQEDLSIDQARILVIRASELLLEIINTDPRAPDLLEHYPFNCGDISLFIGLNEIGRVFDSSRGYDKLAAVSTSMGIVRYKELNPLTDRYKTVLQEPFKEAARIVHQGGVDSAPGEK